MRYPQQARARGSRLGQGLDSPAGGFEFEGKGYVAKDFYVYAEDFASAAAPFTQGDILTGNIVIQADSEFILQKLTAMAVTTTDTVLEPPRLPITVLVVDTGSGRQLTDKAVPLGNIFGSARFPFIMPTPRLFAARSTIELTLEHVGVLAGTSFQSVKLSFVGFKAYPIGN